MALNNCILFNVDGSAESEEEMEWRRNEVLKYLDEKKVPVQRVFFQKSAYTPLTETWFAVPYDAEEIVAEIDDVRRYGFVTIDGDNRGTSWWGDIRTDEIPFPKNLGKFVSTFDEDVMLDQYEKYFVVNTNLKRQYGAFDNWRKDYEDGALW